MQTTHNATNPGGKGNIAIFLFFAFCIAFVAQTCHAQIWQNFKGIRLVNESDTAQQLSVQGSLFYDDVLDSLYLYNGARWINLTREPVIPVPPPPLDSTNFWRTKSNFNLYQNRTTIGLPGFSGEIELRTLAGAGDGLRIGANGLISFFNYFTGQMENYIGLGGSAEFGSLTAGLNLYHSTSPGNAVTIQNNLDLSYYTNSKISTRSGSLEIDADSYIILSNLPTTDPCGSAPSGTLWNDTATGNLKICP